MTIIGKNRGVTIQIKMQGESGTLALTVHGKTKQEVYNDILFLFQSLATNQEEVSLRFYNTIKRRSENEERIDEG